MQLSIRRTDAHYQVAPLFLKGMSTNPFAAADADVAGGGVGGVEAARARVRAVFDLLVREGTSGLAADDLTAALAHLDIKLSTAKTRWMMEEMDVDGDGTIGFDEAGHRGTVGSLHLSVFSGA